MKTFMFSAIVGLSALSLVACQSMTGKTAGQTVSDAGITASVQGKLTGQKMANFPRIDVDTERGVVTLNGVVRSATDKEEAGRLARQVDGVRSVNNNLQVQSQAPASGTN